jgi:nitroimidazol reductase NimA-like FMN-containing flavoprotein (pyridoxamine 5'-phosphate oxidase superfamily)
VRRFAQISGTSESLWDIGKRLDSDWGSSGRRFKSCQPDAGRTRFSDRLDDVLSPSYPNRLTFPGVRRYPARARPGRTTSVMNKQELARELGHPDAQKLLSGSMARLAYNGHDGFPRVIPVGFYWTGEHIVISTAPTSPKARALSSRPEVALTIDTGSTPEEAKALLVRGLARLETVDGVTDEYLAAARRSMDEPQLAEFEYNVRSMYKQMVRISIEPHWARFYDFGAGRLPAFLADLVNDG